MKQEIIEWNASKAKRTVRFNYIAAIRSSALNAQPLAEGFQNNDDRNFDFDAANYNSLSWNSEIVK